MLLIMALCKEMRQDKSMFLQHLLMLIPAPKE